MLSTPSSSINIAKKTSNGNTDDKEWFCQDEL